VRYLLVDEYQDTNASQYLLVKMLIGMRNQFTVVGDDDQSIYAWRGARPENLMLLKEDYPSLKMVMLEQNYRSTSRILRCANVLIANNPHAFEKQLWSEMGVGDEIRVIRCRTRKPRPNAWPWKSSPCTCAPTARTATSPSSTAATTRPS
jgi:ATP-dependent DNA helicase Rep